MEPAKKVNNDSLLGQARSLVAELEAGNVAAAEHAIDELGGADGLRVHRSHWVATDAVAGHSTDKGRVFLELEDGSQVLEPATQAGALPGRGFHINVNRKRLGIGHAPFN